MDCRLCNKQIMDYDARFHHLKIDDSNSVDICTSCSDKFLKWQGGIIARLYPTKALKKRFERDK